MSGRPYSREKPSHQQALRFAASFRRRRAITIGVGFAVFASWAVVGSAVHDESVWFAAWAAVAFIGVTVTMGVWRCPRCHAQLGRSLFIKRCPMCWLSFEDPPPPATS